MRRLVILLGAGLLAACASRKRNEPAPAGPPLIPLYSNRNVIITPGHATTGRVASVNPAGRFVVLTFPLGTMPPQGKRLNIYRGGLKVGEVKVSGLPLDINIIADIVAGESQVGDEVREE